MSDSSGPKPELCWLPVGLLTVNPKYQRDTESRRSQGLIQRIAHGFKWAAFNVIVVTENGQGGYDIIDGQHRVAAVRLRGGIDEVPCVVIEAASVEDAARAFVQANRDRVAVTPLQLHHSMLAAGDPEANHVDRICKEAGISVLRYPVQASNMKPGQTLAIGALQAVCRGYDEAVVVPALQILSDAFRSEAGRLRAPLIKAACWLQGSGKMPPRNDVIGMFRRNDHTTLNRLAADWRDGRGMNPAESWGHAILQKCGVDVGKPFPEGGFDWSKVDNDPFEEGPKQRRCQDCNAFFRSTAPLDIRCSNCNPSREAA